MHFCFGGERGCKIASPLSSKASVGADPLGIQWYSLNTHYFYTKIKYIYSYTCMCIQKNEKNIILGYCVLEMG
jgi:hypothetical protein